MSIENSKNKILFLLLLSLSVLILNSNSLIIANNLNPIVLKYPSINSQNQKLMIHFRLENSVGLKYGQFIGVTFNKQLGDLDLLFSRTITKEFSNRIFEFPRFSCLLEDLTNSNVIILDSSNSKSNKENHIAYCQLKDKYYSLTNDIDYRLTIVFDNIKIKSLRFIPSIGLFLSTSDEIEKLILDALPVIGSVGQYEDYKKTSKNPLIISNFENKIVTGSGLLSGSNVLYLYNFFDLTVHITAKDYIDLNEFYLVFKFPIECVSLPTNVETIAVDSRKTNSDKLKGNIFLTPFYDIEASKDSGFLLLDGIQENLFNGREFKLIFKNILALDKVLSKGQLLEMFLFYKNTYSIYSYSSTMAFFISNANISISSISHVENENIYENAAWPIKFNFSFNSDLLNGGYVLVQHTNAKLNANMMNFIASTCDFSENISDNDNNWNDYGLRPICHPFNTNFDYQEYSESSNFKGSGIFFKINKITSNKNYSLTVWVFAEECGTESIENSLNHKTNFGFTISVYKEIDQLLKYEKRLNWPNKNNIVLAISQETLSKITCIGNTLFNGQYEHQDDPSVVNYELSFKEVSEFEILSSNSQNCFNNSCYINDITVLTNKYLRYYNQDIVGVQENIFPLINIPFLIKQNEQLQNVIPFAIYSDINNDMIPIKGRTRIMFSKDQYNDGKLNIEGVCGYSWGYYIENVNTEFKNLNFDNVTKNYISTANNTVSLSTSLFPNLGSKSMYKIDSEFLPDESTVRYVGTDYSKICNLPQGCKSSLNVYTDCLTWKTNPLPYKSIFNYIEIIISFNFQTENAINDEPIRVIRLIKLLPEAGVLNDPSKNTFNYVKDQAKHSDNVFIYHTSFNESSDERMICVLEIQIEAINSFINSEFSSNVLYIFLFNVTLLEMDLNDIGSVYPILDNNSKNILAFGNNSQYFLSEKSVLNEFYYDSKDSRLTQDGTHYHFFLASYITIPSLSDFKTGKINRNFLIPTYCPRKQSINLNVPVITFLLSRLKFEDSNIYSEGSSSNSQIESSQDLEINLLENNGRLKVITNNMKLFKIGSNQRAINILPSNILKYNLSYSSQRIYGTPRFSNYLSNSNTDKLSIFLGAVNKSNSNYIKNMDSYQFYVSCVVYFSHSSLEIKNQEYYTELFLNNNLSEESYTYLYKSENNATVLPTNKGIGFSGKFFKNMFISIFTEEVEITSDKVSKMEAYNLNSNSNSNDLEKQVFNQNEHSNFSLIGIIRPQLEFFLTEKTDNSNNNEFIDSWKITDSPNISGNPPILKSVYLNDLIAVYTCFKTIKDNSPNNFSLTNFIYDHRISNKVDNFILDFNPVIAPIDSFVENSFYVENTDNLIVNDKSINIHFKYTVPIFYSQGAYIRFSNFENEKSLFDINTTCGIIDEGFNYVESCFNQIPGIYNTFICPLNKIYNIIEVCCYNLELSPILEDEYKIKLNSLEIIYSNDYLNKTFLENYQSKVVVAANTNDLKGIKLSKLLLKNPRDLGISSITSINYYHVNQEYGIGKVVFTIKLPRQLIRNSVIKINGKFKELIIPNSKQYCQIGSSINSNISISSSEDLMILKSCLLQLDNEKESIVIKMNKEIYKCGLNFTNSIFVTINPVIQVNWNELPFKNYLYSIGIFSIDTGVDLVYNNSAFKMPTINYSKISVRKSNNIDIYTPTLKFVWGNLCMIKKIFPSIPEEESYYDFEFDLETTSSSLYNQSINEFTIFFPYSYFPSDLKNIKCVTIDKKLGSNSLNCYSSSDWILNIIFSFTAKEILGKRIVIRIFGLKNSVIIDNLSIPCSINRVNYLGQRVNIVNGSGLLIGGIDYPTSYLSNDGKNSLIGNLKVINKDAIWSTIGLNIQRINSMNSLIPRTDGILNLRISLDKASDSFLPTELKNYPIFIVNMPKQYRLYDYEVFSISVTLEIWSVNGDSLQLLNSVSIKNVEVNYSSIVIFTSSQIIKIDSNFAYFNLIINNIPSPPETIDSTSSFKVLIFNENKDYLFKTFTNLDTMSTLVLNNKLDDFLSYSRGLSYSFDFSKMIPEILESSLFNTKPTKFRLKLKDKNHLEFTPGKFYEYSFVILNETLLMQISSLYIYLIDKNFSLAHESYYVTTGKRKTDFLIGTSCFTTPGIYIIFFSQIASVNYSKLPQIFITLKNIEIDYISIKYQSVIPQSSSTYIHYSLPISNYDNIIINWREYNTKNDSTAMITSASITFTDKNTPKSIFSINNITKERQIFQAFNPNYCFHLSTNIISFSFNSNLKTNFSALNESKISDMFEYVMASDIENINLNNSLDHTSTIISFNPTKDLIPCFISCSIRCKNENFSLNTLENQLFTDSVYHNYLSEANVITEIHFKELSRNSEFEIDCKLSSTQTNKNDRDSILINIEQMRNQISKIKSSIRTKEIPSTECVKFHFDYDPGYLVKINLLNKCQNLFSSEVEYSGCIECVDSYGNNLSINPKINIRKCSTNENIKGRNYIMNNKKNLKSLFDEYTICIIVDKFCPSDVKEILKDKFNEFLYNTSNSEQITKYLNFPKIDLNKSFRFSDIVKPDISILKVLKSEYKNTGEFKIQFISEENFLCFWKIKENEVINNNGLNIIPSFEELHDCAEPSFYQDSPKSESYLCGQIQVNHLGNEIYREKSLFFPANYNLWIMCANDLPQYSNFSEIVIIDKFTITRIESVLVDTKRSKEFFLKLNLVLIIIFITAILL